MLLKFAVFVHLRFWAFVVACVLLLWHLGADFQTIVGLVCHLGLHGFTIYRHAQILALLIALNQTNIPGIKSLLLKIRL